MTREKARRTSRGFGAEVDERRRKRREELLDAAVRCIRREGAAASMDRLAAEAGVTKPILYRHFRDKAGLYAALAHRYTDQVGRRIRRALAREERPRVLLVSAIDAYLGLVERDREVYRFLLRRARLEQGSARQAIDDFIRRLGDEIAVLLGEQLRAAGLDAGGAEIWGHALVGMVNSAAEWWVDRPVISRDRLVAYLADLVWDGFAGIPRPEASAADKHRGSAAENVVSLRSKR